MTLNGDSSIVPCEDSHDVPMVQCDFVSIADLETREKDSVLGEGGEGNRAGRARGGVGGGATPREPTFIRGVGV